MTDWELKLTDENAQRVLARALELQAQSAGLLTVVQIREIASELSIPESAVNQALSEYQTASATEFAARTDTAVTRTSLRRHWSARPVVIALAMLGGTVALLAILVLVMRLFPPS
jgi:hypothetical protein